MLRRLRLGGLEGHRPPSPGELLHHAVLEAVAGVRQPEGGDLGLRRRVLREDQGQGARARQGPDRGWDRDRLRRGEWGGRRGKLSEKKFCK